MTSVSNSLLLLSVRHGVDGNGFIIATIDGWVYVCKHYGSGAVKLSAV